MSELLLTAPMAGWIAPLDEVPDPVFAERILGDGLAIDPTGSSLHAPCDGVIVSAAKHAVTLRAAGGAEILMHVGLETVALGGQGFISHVAEGRSVRAGDALISFDLEFLAPRVKSLISPIVVTNGEGFRIARRAQDVETAVGAFLMALASGTGTAEAAVPGGSAQRTVIVALAHGIHARPAATLAGGARRFASDIALLRGARRANARSVAALMALGVRQGDRVTIEATGSDAAAAVEALAALIASGLDEAPASRAFAPPVPRIAAADAQAPESGDPDRIRGVRAAPGIALGLAVQYRAPEIAVPERGAGIAEETAAFARALGAVRARLEAQAATGDRQRRDILSAHIALLDDPELTAAARRLIGEGKSAGFAWRSAVRALAGTFRAMEDARMRERAADLLDLERQVLGALTGTAAQAVPLPQNAVILADELLPSELVALDAARVAGFVTAGGGPTSHVAIIAAGMNVPALVGAGARLAQVKDGTPVLLDADAGLLHLAPDEAASAAARTAIAERAQRRTAALAHAADLCRTADGTRIEVFANLGAGPLEARQALEMGAEGCGLLRTEFLFQDRETPPGEDEQFEEYQAIADALAGRPFILRTFDVGGDKPVAYLPFPPEENPALGLRGIRAGFWWPGLLRAQLAAATRVRPLGQCRIMLPMVTSLGELKAARAILDALCEERGVSGRVPLGVMVETPSSALIADQLAAEADFLSIGTNDLTQYVLAMDRGHALLASQIDALHPAVLRLIGQAAKAGRAAGRMVAVCGGLAADPLAAPLLIGLGVGELSMPPPSIPIVKAAIARVTMEVCRAVAAEALAADSPAQVRALLRGRLAKGDA